MIRRTYYRSVLTGVSRPMPLPGGPRHPRPPGRTLAGAISANAYKQDELTEMPMLAGQLKPSVGRRKSGPLIGPPYRPRVKKV